MKKQLVLGLVLLGSGQISAKWHNTGMSTKSLQKQYGGCNKWCFYNAPHSPGAYSERVINGTARCECKFVGRNSR